MKTIIKVLTGLLILAAVVVLAIVILFKTRQNAIEAQITRTIKEYVNADVDIGSVTIGFWSTFPVPSVEINDLTIKDSLYYLHQKPFFKADKVFITVDVVSVFSGKSRVSGVKIEQAEFNVFTAASGAANDYVFKGRDSQGTNGNKMIKHLQIHEARFNSVNEQKGKSLSVVIHKLNTKVKHKKNVYQLNTFCDIFIETAIFNNKPSSILSSKKLTADFKMMYDNQAQKLNADSIEVDLNGRQLNIGVSVDLKGPAPVVSSKINSGRILLF